MVKKYRKIEFKIIIPVLVFMIISAIVLQILAGRHAEDILEDSIQEKLGHLQKEFYNQLDQTIYEAWLTAQLFSHQGTIDALKTEPDTARELLLMQFRDKPAAQEAIGNDAGPYNIRFYKADGQLLLNTGSSRQNDKFGRNLSVNVKKVLKTGKAIEGFEVTNMGAYIHAVIPLISNNKIVGAVEAYCSPEYLTESMSDSVTNYMLFSTRKNINSYKGKKPFIGNHVLEAGNEKYLDLLDADLLNAVSEEKQLVRKNLIAVSAVPVLDSAGGFEGIAVLVFDIPNLVDKNKQFVQFMGVMEIIWLLFVFIFSYFLIRRVVTRPIRQIISVTEHLGGGDLRELFDEKRRDEIGFLGKSLNTVFSKIRNDLASLKSSAENVYYAGDQLNNTSQNVSQGSSEQAASVEEVSASMEQMSANIEQNNNNAQVTEKEIFLASASVYEGSKSVKKTADLMKTIDEKIQIVDQIAKQTNILALNASVEAANAGEAGEGFSVIAREIRELAEKSRRAAIDIQEATETGVNISEKSNKELTDIVKKMERAVELIKQISNAGKEQKHGVDQVNGGVEQLNRVTQQNAAVAEEMATNAEELVSQSEMLKNIVASYKISDKTQEEADADLNLDNLKRDTGFITETTDDDDDSFESFSDTTTKTPEHKSGNGDGFTYDLDDDSVSDDDFEKF